MYKYLISLILLIGCNSSSSYIEPVKRVEVSHEDKNFDFDTLLSYSHSVVLESTNESLIGVIDKVQIFHDTIYISDRQSQTIFCFASDGSFITKLNKQGKSKDEYLELTDFEVKENGNIVVYDGERGQLLEYKGGLMLLSRLVLNGGVAIKLLENDLIAMNLGNGISTHKDQGNYNYVVINGKDDIVKRSLPFNKVYLGRRFIFGEGKSYFYHFNNKLYMTSVMDDNIYELDSYTGDIAPRLKFDFGINRPDHNASNEESLAHCEQLNKNVPSSPFSLYVNGDTVLVNYIYQLQPRVVSASVSGGFNNSGSLGIDSNMLPLNIIPYLDSDNSNYLLSVVSPICSDRLVKIKERKGVVDGVIDDIIEKADGNSNPLLLFYTWR